MAWWLWLLAGLALLAAEMLTPGGIFALFFGVAALLIGILTRFGLAGPPWMQWALFSVLSVVSLLIFRRPILEWLRRREIVRPPVDSIVGETAIVLESIPVRGVGKAELRGSSWSARGVDGEAVPAGARCRVQRVDGLMLWIKAD